MQISNKWDIRRNRRTTSLWRSTSTVAHPTTTGIQMFSDFCVTNRDSNAKKTHLRVCHNEAGEQGWNDSGNGGDGVREAHENAGVLRCNIQVINSIAANWQCAERCTKRNEHNYQHAIALIRRKHHKNRLGHKGQAVEILSNLCGIQDASFLQKVCSIADEEENDAESQVRNCRDEAAVGQIKV